MNKFFALPVILSPVPVSCYGMSNGKVIINNKGNHIDSCLNFNARNYFLIIEKTMIFQIDTSFLMS